MADIELKVETDEAMEKLQAMLKLMEQLNQAMETYVDLFTRANELYEKFKRPDPIYVPYYIPYEPKPITWPPGTYISDDNTAVKVTWTLK